MLNGSGKLLTVFPFVHEPLVDAGGVEHGLFANLVVARPFGPDQRVEQGAVEYQRIECAEHLPDKPNSHWNFLSVSTIFLREIITKREEKTFRRKFSVSLGRFEICKFVSLKLVNQNLQLRTSCENDTRLLENEWLQILRGLIKFGGSGLLAN